jgi:DNA (cytosine-5)-methyltransferase 1
MIRCLSVCSGIEAWSCAVEGMDGYAVSALSEIEPFPCAVLAERYPFVPNLGDMTKINGWAMRGQIDLLVGGTPCQGFSVAGLRGGLDDPRSGLAGHYVRLAAELRVPWLLWENVPGALSTSGGADFLAFVSALDELGYGLAWAVLDAQWFGVAQRRSRLFLVGRLGDWRGPGQVLFEPGRVCRNPPARRRKGEGDPSPAEGVARKGGFEEGIAIFAQNQREEVRMLDVPGALAAEPGMHQQSYVVQNVCPTMTSSGAGFARVDGRAEHDCGTLVVQPNEVSATLCASGAGTDRPSAQASQEGFCVVSTPPACPLDLRHLRRDDASWGGLGAIDEPTTAMTSMNTGGGNPLAVAQLQPPLLPRRLTPVECERLQGFPDGWTDVQFQGKPARDTLRYRALGNSMAVPVMRWLAEGIREFF